MGMGDTSPKNQAIVGVSRFLHKYEKPVVFRTLGSSEWDGTSVNATLTRFDHGKWQIPSEIGTGVR